MALYLIESYVYRIHCVLRIKKLKTRPPLFLNTNIPKSQNTDKQTKNNRTPQLDWGPHEKWEHNKKKWAKYLMPIY